ncbi:hypothetical protein C8J57DRAFT_1231044 [Mycena rebaudengoi]|nr:hypothetical protein C8J57DRAFT_1231044 [Mycena rebaudengoi]
MAIDAQPVDEVFSAAQAARSASRCARSASDALVLAAVRVHDIRSDQAHPAIESRLPPLRSLATLPSAIFESPQLPLTQFPSSRASAYRNFGGSSCAVASAVLVEWSAELSARSSYGGRSRSFGVDCRTWILRRERVGGGGEARRGHAAHDEDEPLATASFPREDMRTECCCIEYRVSESGAGSETYGGGGRRLWNALQGPNTWLHCNGLATEELHYNAHIIRHYKVVQLL